MMPFLPSLLRPVGALYACFLFSFSWGQNSLPIAWTNIAEDEWPQASRSITTQQAEVFRLDEVWMKNTLDNARTIAEPSSLILPLDARRTVTFEIEEHQTFEAELQAQFPNIRTYIGRATDGSGAVAYLDFTEQGFHAMILRPGQTTVFIDPWNHRERTGVYLVYNRDQFVSTETLQCGVHGADDPVNLRPGRTAIPLHQNPKSTVEPDVRHALADMPGEQLRTYRLALACTGEYTTFHGGTVAGALSAMATTMNRVNGVYERDVAIHMNIIGNNNLIVYTNGATDPYTNNSGSTMLNENQTNCDAVIGSANYDIGHVFSTGGGGIAQLQSPCGSGKARGVTGGGSPVGDPFDIDYVAHEMGHQFGGNHTQNNPCNRASSAAYEPGSASTIMGYAGICAPNLQSNSDDHFHNHSINEMINFSVNGNGNTCAVITATGNTAPTVEAGSNGLTIPANTPFELTATGFDADGDALTYNWEEYDLGPATASGDNNLTNPSGTQPIFRSWSSTESPTRVFPRIPDLVAGTSTIGELLPTYSRAMNFKCTVKDNVAGGGGLGQDLLSFDVDGNSGPFEVTAPNGSNAIAPGIPQVVSWSVAGTDQPPVSCTAVDIWLSTDGGYTFDVILATGTDNDGSEAVIFPSMATTNARIKIKAAGNHFFDISDQNFSIDPSLNPVDDDLGLSGVSGVPAGGCGAEFNPYATVTNFGVNTQSAFEVRFTANVNGGIPDTVLVAWTGELGIGESVDVYACDATCFNLPEGASGTLDVILFPPAEDENPNNHHLSQDFELGAGQPVLLTLTTDCWGGEVGWTLSEESGTVIESVSAGSMASNTTYNTEFCLTDGCYLFEITDTYGDGMAGSLYSSCGVDGNYAMTDDGGEILFAMGSANYGFGTDHSFCLESGIDCLGDLDGNGTVDVSDLLLILANFGCVANCTADIDNDGQVGVTDVLAMLSEFAASCN